MRTGRDIARGFTLIEVMITIAIITILIVLSVPGLQKSRTATFEASAVTGLNTMYSAFEMHMREVGYYPPMDAAFSTNYFPAVKAYLPPDLFQAGTADAIAKGYELRARTDAFAGAPTDTQGRILGTHIFTIGAFPLNPELRLRTFFVEAGGTVTEGNAFNNF